jgi:hypothetical protein
MIRDTMIASVLFSVLAGVAAPSPSPSPPFSTEIYPQIIHTVTSETCTELHKLVMPVGFVTKKNDEAIDAMAFKLQKFLSGIDPQDVPSLAELQAAINGGDVGTGANADEVDPSANDDTLLYGPSQVIKAAQIDTIANEIYGNLVTESSFMKQSWSDYPQGSDAKVDEMRQHAQNLMDLQRSLADKYENFARTYLSNQNMAFTQSPSQREFFKLYMRALLLGQAAALGQPGTGDNTDDGYLSQSERARLGDVAQVVQGLRKEERIFAPEEISTYNECNSAHILIETPTPSPAP